MALRDQYRIEPVSYATAMRIVVEHHYLHRKAPCSMAFGLIRVTDSKVMGVVCYGTPSSAPLRSGIAGKNNSFNVMELTRLWIADEVGKNAESFLIGNTINKVNKEIIVSYAEIEAGHVGTVYQATNWLYTGLSAKRTNWTIDGIDKHCQTIADKYRAVEIRAKYGDAFRLVDRPRKHRYIFLNCSKRRRSQLLKEIKYPFLPYPKNNLK